MGGFLIQLGRTVWAIVGPTAGAAVAAMAVALVKTLLAKQRLELTEAQAKELERQITEAIGAVEERAHRATKDGQPLSSAAKAAIVTNVVMERRPDLPRADVERLIDAALTTARSQGKL